MKIKITAQTVEHLNYIVGKIMNAATVVAMNGHIPSSEEMDEPKRRGRFWYLEEDNGEPKVYRMYSMANNHSAYIVKVDFDNPTMVLDFHFRYDNNRKVTFSSAMCYMASAMFPENVNLLM